MPSLTQLDLSNAHNVDMLSVQSSSAQNNPALRSFSLAHVQQCSDATLQHICLRYANLHSLNLSHILTLHTISVLEHLPALTHLNLSHCEEVRSDDFLYLSNKHWGRSILTLHLAGLYCNAEHLFRFISNCTALTFLNVQELKSVEMRELQQRFGQLTVIQRQELALESPSPEHPVPVLPLSLLSELKQLESIDLSDIQQCNDAGIERLLK